MPLLIPENPDACAQRLPRKVGEAKWGGLPRLPSLAAFSCLGEVGKANNDSLSQPLVIPQRHVIPCRTGTTCCYSGLFSCCFSPVLDGECSLRTKRLGQKGHSPVHLRVTQDCQGPRGLTMEKYVES